MMVKVYVEPRPKGLPEGTRIDDYAVEDHADSVLTTAKTQEGAIQRARARGHSPVIVARVRDTDKGRPDHWRQVD